MKSPQLNQKFIMSGSFNVLLTVLATASTFKQGNCLKKSPNGQPNIVIIGAGLAGLSAADRLLNDHNFQNVKIIEATRYIGGRVRPVFYPGSVAGVLELGSEWLTGRKFNPLFDSAIDIGALSITGGPFDQDELLMGAFLTSNGCRIGGEMRSKLNQFAYMTENTAEMEIHQSQINRSIEALYEKVFSQIAGDAASSGYHRALMNIIKKECAMKTGVDVLSTASLKTWRYSRDKALDRNIRLGPYGHQPILAHFVRRIGLHNIVLGKSVRLIDYSSSRVRLVLSDDSQIYADHVIVTSSLGYLKRNAAFMFRPPLPAEKRVTIQKMGYGTIDKLYLIYEKPFWSQDSQILNLLRIENDPWNCRTHFYAQRNETELENVFWRFSVHPYIKNVISTVIVGDLDPAKFELADHNELVWAATSTLRRFLNNPYIPIPKQIIRTRWALDPFFLGSIAYVSMDCEKDPNCQPRNLATPVNISGDGIEFPALSFAGDAVSVDLHYATQGAVLSGRKQADSIKRFFT